MKLTKYEHACLVLEEQGQRLVIDPGVFSESFADYTNVVAIVITHVHADHLKLDTIKSITAQNPGVPTFTVQNVADELQGMVATRVVKDSDAVTVGSFRLTFSGGEHAVIHPSLPLIQNVGVMVNDTFYYPGDSFSLPPSDPALLAVPASAPWMKISEAMDFIASAKPKQVFPTHNAILSDTGESIYYHYLESAAQDIGATFIVLKPGHSLSV